jgi:hypothetical protein
MAFGNQGIFPTTIHGQITDSYGLPTYTSSANPFSSNTSTGLIIGQGWLLFDFTIVSLLKSSGAIAANAACNFQAGNSNTYTVQSALATTNPGQVPVVALNDRGGAITVSGAIQWMTTSGLGTALCAANLPASSNTNGTPLVSSTTVTGQLQAGTAGTAFYNNILLLNTTTVAGSYPVFIQ